MPKKGGKKKGKKSNEISEKRPLVLADNMQEYAKIIKALGDRKMSAILTDSSEIIALVPGKFRKRVWINAGDIVLISRRAFENKKVDIIYKYFDYEVLKLHKKGDIPYFFLESKAICDENQDCGISIRNFEEEEEEENFDFDNL